MTNKSLEIHGINIDAIVRCIELHNAEYPYGTQLFSDAYIQLQALRAYVDQCHISGFHLACEHGVAECSDDGVVFKTYEEALSSKKIRRIRDGY